MTSLRDFFDEEQLELAQVVDDIATKLAPDAGDEFPHELLDALQCAGFDDLDGEGAQFSTTILVSVARHSASTAWHLARRRALQLSGDTSATGDSDICDGVRFTPDLLAFDMNDGHVSGHLDRVSFWGPDRNSVALITDDAAYVVQLSNSRFEPMSTTGMNAFTTGGLEFRDAPYRRIQGNRTSTGSAVDALSVGATAVAAGVAMAALQMAERYVSERHQFGNALNRIERVSDRIQASNALVSRVFAALFSPAIGSVRDVAGTAEWVIEDALDVVTTSLQLHGGYGYMEEYHIQDRLRDLLSLRAEFATLRS